MPAPFPEPTSHAGSRSDVFLAYLDYFRSEVVRRVQALPEHEVRSSRLPSGWTPLELLHHLTYVELRWIEWGFEGRPVDDPWGDGDPWQVPAGTGRGDLVRALEKRAERTAAVIRSRDLDEPGAPGPRWDGAAPATLERVLFHLLQEYARHAGHLDVVAELAGGPVGE